jgi:hypothetical protein
VDVDENAHRVKSVARRDIASQSMPDAATAGRDLGAVTARPQQEIQCDEAEPPGHAAQQPGAPGGRPDAPQGAV